MPKIIKYQWGGNALFNNPLFASLPFANMVGPTGNSSDGKANPLAGIQSFLGLTPSSNITQVQEASGASGTSGNLVSQDQGIAQAAVPEQLSLAGGGIGSIINAGKNFKSLAGAMKDAKAAGEGLKGLRTNIAGNVIGMAGNVLDMASSFIPGLEDQYAGPKGDITQTVDSAYDNVSNTLMAIPGVGAIAGGAMKIGGFVGDILDSAGIGTDKMTTKDAILDSNFLKLTPFGLINALGAKKTTTLTKDNEAFEQVGSSYGGISYAVDDALKKAGKKYGLFSSKERREADSEISEARRQQMQMAAIADNAADRFAITDSMAAINNNRRALALQGGYNQAAVRVGRSGMSLDLIAKTKKILSEPRKLQTGGTAKDPFEYYVSTLPVAQRDSSNFRVRDYWQYNGQPKDFDEAKKKGMFEWVEDFDSNGKSLGWSWHAFTVAKNPNADEYDFMKSSSHPTVQKELDWYNSNSPDAVEFRNNYELQRTEPYWKYVRRKNIQSHKEGGSIIEITSLPTEILLVDPNEVPEFQDGGRISKKIRDYYKDYNLDEITVINDSSPRTENDTIYSPSDEFTVHELWHYISQNKPNEALKEFYDSLNDNKLLQFGADLDFIKRTGDPSDFYNPSELEARLKAAKFMSQGQNYTKDFFKNLRSNENQYGDNMRDLLRMFNDDYLEKLFNINSAQKFQEGGSINVIPTEIELVSLDDIQEYKEGGSINVIPEGALHARLHHMNMDGITKKGIPVVDNNGVQQAEIEHSEIIFRIEVTKKLEELQKKYYSENYSDKEKNEFALEAGQLLVDEVLHNTDDRIGLIKEVK